MRPIFAAAWVAGAGLAEKARVAGKTTRFGVDWIVLPNPTAISAGPR